MRRGALLTTPRGLTLPAIGSAFMGGYYAGIIDTTRAGAIIGADASQTGKRYALIVAAKSLEQTSLTYKTENSLAPAASRTRWDGLSATVALATDAATYPAADYCYGLTYPSDAASRWYLPAMDELEVVYRNLKATAENNNTGSRNGGTFPGGTVYPGTNPSSEPVGAAYTSTVPGQTSVAAFKDGGGQELGQSGSSVYYWTATEYDASYAWIQAASGSAAGLQDGFYKPNNGRVRPVRRLEL